jgi:pyridoxamine 5'-phosphate oxidase
MQSPLLYYHSMNNPYPIIETWFAQAQQNEPNDPNAAALATATENGLPSVRMVLLKSMSENGFIFFTNTQSRKGGELITNPHAALLIHWKSLRKQIRIEGKTHLIDAAESDAYFATRSRNSRLGACASNQSRVLLSRDIFLERFEAAKLAYQDKDIPRPAHWAGFCLTPAKIELWEDMPHRLHHRQLFTLNDTVWHSELLYP